MEMARRGNILGSGVNGINISASATDVVILRNLNLSGEPGGVTGINITGGLVVVIEDCIISQFKTGISFTPSVAGAQLIIKNTTIGNMQWDGGQSHATRRRRMSASSTAILRDSGEEHQRRAEGHGGCDGYRRRGTR